MGLQNSAVYSLETVANRLYYFWQNQRHSRIASDVSAKVECCERSICKQTLLRDRYDRKASLERPRPSCVGSTYESGGRDAKA